LNSDAHLLAAFVTGAGWGIGRATALRLARDGYGVGVFDLRSSRVEGVVICPGTVESEWITKILANNPDPGAARRAMSERQLDGRMGTPDEVAAGIAFIASADGRFINGSEFVMDGGMTAR